MFPSRLPPEICSFTQLWSCLSQSAEPRLPGRGASSPVWVRAAQPSPAQPKGCNSPACREHAASPPHCSMGTVVSLRPVSNGSCLDCNSCFSLATTDSSQAVAAPQVGSSASPRVIPTPCISPAPQPLNWAGTGLGETVQHACLTTSSRINTRPSPPTSGH